VSTILSEARIINLHSMTEVLS